MLGPKSFVLRPIISAHMRSTKIKSRIDSVASPNVSRMKSWQIATAQTLSARGEGCGTPEGRAEQGAGEAEGTGQIRAV